MIHTDTIAAIATGMNTAGIGIIRISGDDSFSVVKKIYRTASGKTVDEFEDHKVYYGYIYDDDRLIDEVLVVIMKAPKSFTKEDVVEIDCHGGILIMQKILKTVLKNGARPADPGEFTKRAFLNGRIDLSKAEAVIDLINSKTEYAMDNSLKHLTGKLFEMLTEIKDSVLYEIAYIESALDDPEHYDLTGYSEQLKEKLSSIKSKLLILIDSYKDGQILSEGIETVILGKPNVGKSSILNSLLGNERAIVTEVAGTTRDSIREQILINGIVLNIIDTAGIHSTNDIVEKIGVERSRELAQNADLVLMVIDSSVALNNEDIEILDLIKDKKSLILLNKNDLEQVTFEEDIRKYTNQAIISVSAKNSSGIDALKQYINDEFIKGAFKYNDEIFITNERQYQLLTNSVDSINEVFSSIEKSMPEDFYSIDLVNVYDNLCLILGERMEDDVANEIFSKFCMGK